MLREPPAVLPVVQEDAGLRTLTDRLFAWDGMISSGKRVSPWMRRLTSARPSEASRSGQPAG